MLVTWANKHHAQGQKPILLNWALVLMRRTEDTILPVVLRDESMSKASQHDQKEKARENTHPNKITVKTTISLQ